MKERNSSVAGSKNHRLAFTLIELLVGNGFAYGSVAGVTGMNGQTWANHPTQSEILTKRTQVIRPSDKLLFVEENDPRDEKSLPVYWQSVASARPFTPGLSPSISARPRAQALSDIF